MPLFFLLAGLLAIPLRAEGPSGRYGHDAFLDPVSRRLYIVLGEGKDDLWTFDLDRKAWSQVARVSIAERDRPVAAIDEEDRSFIWIDRASNAGKGVIRSVDLSSGTLDAIPCRSPGPVEAVERAFVTRRRFVTIGSIIDPAGGPLVEEWSLGLSTHYWRRRIFKNWESGSIFEKAKAVLADDFLVVLGGAGDPGDARQMSVTTGKWARLESVPWRSVDAAAYAPETNRMFVVGTVPGASGSEAWSFEVSSGTRPGSSRIEAAERPLRSKEARLLVDAGRNRLLFFSGADFRTVQALDLAAGRWTPLDSKTAPQGREGYSLSLDKTTGAVYLFGGKRRRFLRKPKVFDDLWRFDPQPPAWTKLSGED